MTLEARFWSNTPYLHKCLHDDLSVRQEYFIAAENQEEAWEKMASRFPEETAQGFTVEEWEGFNVTVVEIRPDE